MMHIKKAATPEGNGHDRHEDTNFLPLKEPPHQFIGTGPYKGMQFTRILRRDTGFIYCVDMGGQMYYHVFKRRENHYFGTISYPRPEAFGRWAWCYRSLDAATRQLNELGHD